MVVDSLYYNDAGNSTQDTFSFSPEVIRRALLNIYSQDFHPASDIEQNLFNEIWRTLNLAADRGFSQSDAPDPDDDFRNAIRRSNAVFSAFKVHRLQNDMAQLLLDDDGNLKPFTQWREEAQPIASHQCGAWLRTEYDTAVIRAHQAADWLQFQREKDVLPNLRWVPSTSPNPGKDHRTFWNTILPVDDPFWAQHRPGDRWNCKCSLSATDEPTTDAPKPSKKDRPQPGLDNNPANDRKLFSDTHPYIAHPYHGAKEAVEKFLAHEDMKAKRKEIQRKATTLKDEIFRNESLPLDMRITGRGIKEWLNQPHKFYEQKNKMLLSLKHTLMNAHYLGYGLDKHDASIKAHLFEVDIMNEKSWIVVREFSHDRVEVHSISDSKSIKDIIIKKPGNR